jgi:putative acetyltransferase
VAPAIVPAIRPERSADTAAITAVHTASFPTAYEARLVEALRANGRLSVSLVAVDGQTIVGHVAFSPVTLSDVEGGFGLAPVAVLPQSRRQGIAAALIRQGLIDIARAGARFAVVLGSPAYYGRFGFQPAYRRALRDEYEGGDAFQVLELQPGALPASGGVVRYAAEFAALSADPPAGE